MVAADEASGLYDTGEEASAEEPEIEAEPVPVNPPPPAWVTPAQIDRASIAPPAEEPPDWVTPGQYDRDALVPGRAETGAEWMEPGSYDRATLVRPAPGAPEENTSTAEPAAPVVGAGSAESPAAAIAVIDGEDGALGVDLMHALAKALPGIALWPIGLNPDAQAAMESVLGAAPAVPADAVERAAAIVAPGDIVWPGAMDGEVPAALAAAVGRSRGQKVLLPARNPALRWVGTPNWSRANGSSMP